MSTDINSNRRNVDRQNTDQTVCQHTKCLILFGSSAPKPGISQLRICRPPPLSFDPVLMEDAQCAETNKKSVNLFLFFGYREIHRKLW